MGLSGRSLGVQLENYTVPEEASTNVQPESLFNIFTLVPEPKKDRKGRILPFDPAEVEEFKLPKWARMDKRKLYAPVFFRVIGWLKITAWMREIAAEVIDKHFNDWKNGIRKMDPRRVRREFRSRVTATKRQREIERKEALSHARLSSMLLPEELVNKINSEPPIRLPWTPRPKVPRPPRIPRYARKVTQVAPASKEKVGSF